MKEFKSKVSELLEKYQDRFASKGIRIDIRKRYFETAVDDGRSYHPNAMGGILSAIDLHFAKKRENKMYHYQKNRYHCVILSVCPIDQTFVRSENCREYAFLLRRVGRVMIGDEPTETVCAEDPVLEKIEKRILKILKHAEKASPQKVCKNSLRDAARYLFSNNYAYKEKILGMDRLMWFLIEAALVVAILGVAYLISLLLR